MASSLLGRVELDGALAAPIATQLSEEPAGRADAPRRALNGVCLNDIQAPVVESFEFSSVGHGELRYGFRNSSSAFDVRRNGNMREETQRFSLRGARSRLLVQGHRPSGGLKAR